MIRTLKDCNRCFLVEQEFGIDHIVVPAKAPEIGLAELPDKTVATVFPTTGVREYAPGNLGQSESIPGRATPQRRK